ncbi:MAG TPA: CBS domain-containing protein [Vicinamibacterales bacterium]|nr:CBS domain-containing protein [Vicinamibacterales bacterium]
MIVSQLMTTDVATCTPKSDLEHAIFVMLERDCGFVPVVSEVGRLVGAITDRDVCIAIAAHRRTPAHIHIEEAMTHPAIACRPEDTLITALGTMSRHRVHRLPVVDRDGYVQGVISMNDILRAPHHDHAPTSEDIVDTLRAIGRHRDMEPVVV